MSKWNLFQECKVNLTFGSQCQSIRNSNSLLVGMQNWKAIWRFLTKLNIVLSYHQATTLLFMCPPGYPHKAFHLNVYIRFIFNHQNLEETKMSFNRVMDKQIVVSPYNEILQSNRKNELFSYVKSLMNLKCILLFERSQSEKALYCVI